MLRLLTCALLATAASAQITYYSAYLDAAQEVPPTASGAHGWGVVRFDAGASSVQIFCYHTTLVGAPAAAHMHQAAFGVNGGIAVGMAPIAPNTWAGAGVLTPAQVAALTTSGMYLNVHSAAFGGGEIRGQVVPSKSTRFTASLTGAQETPPTGSLATGTGIAFLHEPDNRLVYVVNTAGLVGVTAAHVHQAPFGVAGGVVFGLNGGAGTYCGVSPRLTTPQLAALNADGMYFNIHTAAFGGGEIRGQLRKDVGDHFYAVCDGISEVPPNPSGGLGGAQLILSPTGVVNLTGQFQGLLGAATVAHVHLGAAGVAGPVVFPLTIAGGTVSNTTFAPSLAQLADLRAGLWYVNIHSAVFGGGEIRGQLLPATLPSVYGEGCPSTSGHIPHCGATGFATMGGNINFDLYGVPAGSFSLLFIADNRDPTPVELPALGLASPGCFALITSNLLQFTQVANAEGCAVQPVPVPLLPLLRNIPLYAQWATFDLGANPANLVTSNALSFFIH